MSKRIGIFMDVSNLYGTIADKFGSPRKLDYLKYYKYISDLGEVVMANAYGSQMNNEAKPFITCLRSIGYNPKYKRIKSYQHADYVKHKADWDVGITIDVVKAINNLDVIVLGSADGDFKSLVDWVLEQGKQIIILACGISKDLRETCTVQVIEIPESMLESEKDEKDTELRHSNKPDDSSADKPV